MKLEFCGHLSFHNFTPTSPLPPLFVLSDFKTLNNVSSRFQNPCSLDDALDDYTSDAANLLPAAVFSLLLCLTTDVNVMQSQLMVDVDVMQTTKDSDMQNERTFYDSWTSTSASLVGQERGDRWDRAVEVLGKTAGICLPRRSTGQSGACYRQHVHDQS